MFLRRWYDEIRLAIEYDEAMAEFVDNVLCGNLAVASPNLYDPTTSEDLDDYLMYKLHTNLERIVFMKKEFNSSKQFFDVLKLTNEAVRKNDTIAKVMMKKSEDFIGSSYSQRQRAVRTLNLAAGFATTKTTLGKIFRQRSSWLFILENWNDCVQDTKLGLEMDCPVYMKQELNIRKLKCLGMYRMSRIPELTATHEYRNNVLFKLHKGRNDKILSASSVVEIRESDKGGRGLFVKEDVGPGATLIVEEPYVTNLNECLNWNVDHCWRCLKRMLNPIPCSSCVFAVYCSDACRSEDFTIVHHYECKCLPYFHGASIGPNTHLGFKGILKAGPLELYNIFTTMSRSEIDKEASDGFDPKTGIYDSSAYWSVKAMQSHTEDNGVLPEQVFDAISFIEILDKSTEFFDHVPLEDSQKQRFKEFVASLALTSTFSVPFNCFGLSELDLSHSSLGDEKTDRSRLQRKSRLFVGGLYPLTSLLNHSCDPSVGRVNLTNGTMAIMSLRGLKAGDEIFISYGYEFGNHPRDMRIHSLSKLYLFNCRCTPCKSNWPIYEHLSQIKNKFLCPNCTDGFSYDECYKCVLRDLRNGAGKCTICSNSFPFQTMIDELQSRSSFMESAKQFMLANDPNSAILLLLDHIKFLQRRLCPPSFAICAAQRILMKAYYQIMDN